MALPDPLEVLHEAPDLPDLPLPDELRRVYGGTLGFAEPRVLLNFVSSVDGVVALPPRVGSASLIADHAESDRFVMALLRACADALLMGATTVRSSSAGRWTAASLYPPAAPLYGELRDRLGKDADPELAIVTGSGGLDPAHPALESGALVLTTTRGAERLLGRVPAAAIVVALGEDRVDLAAALELLRARGHRIVLSEGGPTMAASLVAAGLCDELFLTVSPLLAGRVEGDGRPGLLDGTQLLPERRTRGSLLGVRRGGAHLFLRYALADEPA